ncbi:MAG: carbamoyltransferase HypF, partial [Gammaproteobacteria bacterium]|nr:carbamoyltransferase HypF [Gammaproteobacteria bacterium]
MSEGGASLAGGLITRRLTIGGKVQSQTFRSFTTQLAEQLGLVGQISTRDGQLEILAQGESDQVDRFLLELLSSAPKQAEASLVDDQMIESPPLQGFGGTAPAPSQATSQTMQTDRLVLPDIGVCEACRRELNQPGNRRYRYPFANCASCGPRYSIQTRQPFERQHTSMAGFRICPECQNEFADTQDIHYQDEAIACPNCGPAISFTTLKKTYNVKDTIFNAVSLSLRGGNIIAIKGTGGYHLACDASNHVSVRRLRLKKHIPAKPLAVMFPFRGEDGLDAVRDAVDLTNEQAEALRHPSRPIVLCRRKKNADLARMIAPGLYEIGVMLPHSPLQHLLLEDYDRPLVMTSTNIKNEPIFYDNDEAEKRAFLIADAFLHHNRPIIRPAEDSLVRVIAGRARPIRLGRGSAPLELTLPFRLNTPTLAVGSQIKNSIALAFEDRVVITPHLGELSSEAGIARFETSIREIQSLYGVRAEHLVAEADTADRAQLWARDSGLPLTRIRHHHAHAAKLAGEQPQEENWLVFTWTHIGQGEDETIWGGEAMLGGLGHWRRVASLAPYRLPGGDKLALDPWRTALTLCWETDHVWSPSLENIQSMYKSWKSKIQSPTSSSAGRLFDAAAAMLDLCYESSYTEQPIQYLEAACRDAIGKATQLPLHKDADGIWLSDWSPLLPMLTNRYQLMRQRAANFHTSMAQAIVEQALHVKREYGDFAVGLSGEVFLNKRLTEEAMARLRDNGF